MTNFTKKDLFSAIVSIFGEHDPSEGMGVTKVDKDGNEVEMTAKDFVDFATHELDMLNTKTAKKAAKADSPELVERINTVAAILADGVARTNTQIVHSDQVLSGLSTSGMNAVLNKMIERGMVVRKVNGKSATFSLA